MKKEKISKKEKIHILLGAKQFKKVVLGVEKTKWKIIKTFFPNYLKNTEKRLRKQRDKELENATSEQESIIIKNNYKKLLMLAKKEYNTEQNINYHVDILEPSKAIEWLKVNKDIHKRSIKFCLPLIAVETIMLALGFNWIIPLLVLGGVWVIKDLECINLQDYNIIQVEKKIDLLDKYSQRTVKNREKKYGEAQKEIAKKLGEGEELPSIKEMIDSMDSPEKLEQFKRLILEESKRREKQRNATIKKSREKTKQIGGK